MELVKLILLIFTILFTFMEGYIFWNSYKLAKGYDWFDYQSYKIGFISYVLANSICLTTMYLNIFGLIDINLFLVWISFGIAFLIVYFIANSKFRKEKFGDISNELKKLKNEMKEIENGKK
jgi:predicted membrane protein